MDMSASWRMRALYTHASSDTDMMFEFLESLYYEWKV